MHERIIPSQAKIHTLGPEAGERIVDFLQSIHDQYETAHDKHLHHPWLPDSAISDARLRVAMNEVASAEGNVDVLERYMEYILTASIESLQKLPKDTTPLRRDIHECLNNGIAVLDDIDPKKANRVRMVMDGINELSSAVIPRS